MLPCSIKSSYNHSKFAIAVFFDRDFVCMIYNIEYTVPADTALPMPVALLTELYHSKHSNDSYRITVQI
jgi:hypothetical protein